MMQCSRSSWNKFVSLFLFKQNINFELQIKIAKFVIYILEFDPFFSFERKRKSVLHPSNLSLKAQKIKFTSSFYTPTT